MLCADVSDNIQLSNLFFYDGGDSVTSQKRDVEQVCDGESKQKENN